MPIRIVHPRVPPARLRASIRRTLRENSLCSLATVTPHGKAHISTAYFCWSPDLQLYFLSDILSVHCRNLRANPSMAMAIFRSDQQWGKSDRGLQLFGNCVKTRSLETMRAARLYGRRFPTYSRWLQATSGREKQLAEQLGTYRFYRFEPREIKILDEWQFGGGVIVTARVVRE
ncbi:MAG: pyridoxamine 5'-phosphate oxidase family protein [Anaerolineales bacterium]